MDLIDKYIRTIKVHLILRYLSFFIHSWIHINFVKYFFQDA